jgi:hypothetical protein
LRLDEANLQQLDVQQGDAPRRKRDNRVKVENWFSDTGVGFTQVCVVGWLSEDDDYGRGTTISDPSCVATLGSDPDGNPTVEQTIACAGFHLADQAIGLHVYLSTSMDLDGE